ncbi:MAG: type II secretion system F family protein [Deltaproteobacteria bacterium]|nr:MAG: type II secretion system F family protein [Deltaproteobacteria bacterium]TMA55767.1 MAG: type II secretion system F family protein [Deltaproteobacteria bacterium]
MMLGLAALLVFASLALVGYAISGWAKGREESKQTLDRRLAVMTGAAVADAPTDSSQSSVLKDRRLSGIAFLNTVLRRMSRLNPLVRMIRQAGLKKRVGEILLYVPLLGVGGYVGVVSFGFPEAAGLGAGVVAGGLPLMIVRRMQRKRNSLFSEQLPDALDLIRAALQAGHSLSSALYVVADEFPDPIAPEFREVAEEMRLGLPMRDALYNLTERVDDSNLPILIIGILVTQEIGGNLAEVLNNISHTIRERFKLLRETKVMTAQGKMSGNLLSALPFCVAIGVFLMNPTYFSPMLHTTTGLYMLCYAVVSIVFGHVVISRITNIRV